MPTFSNRRARNLSVLSIPASGIDYDHDPSSYDQSGLLRTTPPNLASSPIRKFHFINAPRRRTRVTRQRLFLLLFLACSALYFSFSGRRISLRFPWSTPKIVIYPWASFPLYRGYYNGVRTLIEYDEYRPENPQFEPLNISTTIGDVEPTSQRFSSGLPMSIFPYDPYPNYASYQYLEEFYPVRKCHLDEDGRIPAPDIFAFPGVPQDMPHPIFGSYYELDLPEDVCFDRYGRFGPYGWGYPREEGGLFNLDFSTTDSQGLEELWKLQPKINYALVDWGAAQRRCRQRNKKRFRPDPSDAAPPDQPASGHRRHLPRTAFVLRAFTGYTWTDFEIATIRALVNELALKSSAEYDVHLLVDLKDNTTPIWASKQVYQHTLEAFIPREFWGITTIWSNALMKLYYPGPFNYTIDNNSGEDIYGTYRSGHWALQWFSQQHPEYDYVWNWELDVRYTGHYYDLLEKLGAWTKKQPRKGLWERSSKFWMPSLHGTYEEFSKAVEDSLSADGNQTIWGPVVFANDGIAPSVPAVEPPRSYLDDNYEWGVGEEADLITFNPIFNPNKTNWFFRDDITGFNPHMDAPPRRSSIVTVARLSRRLLDTMHTETYQYRHTAFPEMWPSTCALHHGLKAIYAPHPIYFDRDWPKEYIEQVFNSPETEEDSVFGSGEHNFRSSSFYFNAEFAGGLWRRWIGGQERGEGGGYHEMQQSGRMCLRSTLLHPIKSE